MIARGYLMGIFFLLLLCFFASPLDSFPPRHLSIEEYSRLSEGEKRSLEEEFNSRFHAKSEQKREPFATWWIDALFRLENEIFPAYNKDLILGLGQSTAWLLEAREMMTESKEGLYPIAFSGKFFTFDEKPCSKCGNACAPNYSSHTLLKKSTKFPNSTQIRAFRTYLASLGLNPLHLVEKAEKEGRKIVVMDYVLSGRGMYSFLFLYHDWAKELGVSQRLEKVLHLHFLLHQKDREKQTSPQNFSDYLTSNFSRFVENRGLQIEMTEIEDPFCVLECLFSPKPIHRLIRRNRFSLWDQRVLTAGTHFEEDNARSIYLIRAQMAGYLSKFYKKSDYK